MLDSGSFKTFIKESVAKKMNLYVLPKKETIPLADSKQVVKVIGEVVINIELHGHTYRSIQADVIKNLCTDFIVGRDIQGKHRRVILNYNGSMDDLVIGTLKAGNKQNSSAVDPYQKSSVSV